MKSPASDTVLNKQHKANKDGWNSNENSRKYNRDMASWLLPQ